MAAPPVNADGYELELADIQGLVASAWKELDHAGYLFVQLGERTPSRHWLASIVDQVSRASEHDPALRRAAGGPSRLQIALTHTGMRALGASDQALRGFSDEAKQGMAERARILGDGEDPAWELIPRGTRVDALVMVYAAGEAARDALIATHTERLARAGATVLATEPTSELTPDEHFGFADGISQPTVRGVPTAPGVRGGDGESVPPGEIVLGYRNGYGRLPKGPVDEIDLGRNGTYLVFRKLEQDVVGFWTYFLAQARQLTAAGHGPGPEASAAELDRWADWLAAKVIGRWRSGASLVDDPDAPPEGRPDPARQNAFEFLPRDRDGARCPIGSHIRRANPRDARGGTPAESRLVVDRHRILRRGRSYGPALPRARAIRGEGDGARRGLLFICLQASIARGFEFVQQTWLSNRGFGGLVGEVDPLAGGEEVSTFTIPASPLPLRLRGLPQFVSTRGGGYFFLPAISALRHLAG